MFNFITALSLGFLVQNKTKRLLAVVLKSKHHTLLNSFPEICALKHELTEAHMPSNSVIMRVEGHWAESWEREADHRRRCETSRLLMYHKTEAETRERFAFWQHAFLTMLYPFSLSLSVSLYVYCISTVYTHISTDVSARENRLASAFLPRATWVELG